jgi:hypothetical protein
MTLWTEQQRETHRKRRARREAKPEARVMAYIGRAACGCITLLIADDPQYRNDTASEVAKFIAAGGSIERTTIEAARQSDFGCKCGKAVKA